MSKNKDLYPQCIYGTHKQDNSLFLNCYVCSISHYWSTHKSTEQHLSNLWYFKKHFSDARGDCFFCKLCKVWIPKHLFQSHAVDTHQLAPWYRKNITYELVIYFNNGIQLYENIYYCHLCRSTTSERHLILNHIDTPCHQDNLRKYMGIKTDVILPLQLTKKFILNSMFPQRSMQFKCWSCNHSFDKHETAEEHITTENHKNNLTRVKISLIKNRISKSNSKKGRKNKIKPISDDTSMICDDINNEAGLLQPMSTSSTDNKFLRYFENFVGLHNGCFFCNLCQEEFSSENLASEHLKKEYHCLLKAEVYRDCQITILDSFPSEVYEQFINNYIFPKQKKSIRCLTCHSKPTSYCLAKDHINSNIHLESSKRKVVRSLLSSKNNIFIQIDNVLMREDENNTTEEDMLTDQVEEKMDNFLKFSVKHKNLDKSKDIKLNDKHDENSSETHFLKFFENFIFSRGVDQFCNLCEKSFPSTSSTFTHINSDLNHKDLLEKIRVNQNLTKEKNLLLPNFYEVLVRNNIFRTQLTDLRCFSCESFIVGYCLAEDHINSRHHKVNLKRTIQINNTDQVSIDGNQIITDVQLLLSESKNKFAKYFENYIDIRGNVCYCHLCKSELSSSMVKTHINDLKHSDLLEKRSADKTVGREIKNSFYMSELFVRNGVFQFTAKKLKCFTCEKLLGSIKVSKTHVLGHQHNVYRKYCSSMSSIIDGQKDRLDSSITFSQPIVIDEDNSMKFENNGNNHKENTENVFPIDLVPKAESFATKEEHMIVKPSTIEVECSESGFDLQEPPVDVIVNKFKTYNYNQCPICWKKNIRFSDYFTHLTSHLWRIFSNDIADLLTLVNRDSEVEIIFDKSNSKKENGIPKWYNSASYSNIWRRDKNVRKIKKNTKNKYPNRITMGQVDLDLKGELKMFNIYEMDEELYHSIQLSFNRICIVSKEEVYCMICRRNILFSLQNVYEHFRSIEHSYFLVQMIDDHSKFEAFPNEVSDLYLAREMIEDKSDHHVLCYTCDSVKPVVVPNNIKSLEMHIDSKNHLHKRIELSCNLQSFIKASHSRLERNWFSTQKYWCVICSKQFVFEKLFLRHLSSKTHIRHYGNSRQSQKLIYDYCPVCGLLFYGYDKTYFYHSECKFHKFYLEKNVNFISQLPNAVEKLLIEPNEIAMKKLIKLDEEKNEMTNNEGLLLDNLRNTISDYVDANIHPFGSRISGLGSIDSDLDVFLDCDNLYYKGSVSDDVSFFLNEVEHSLRQSEHIWTINKVIATCRIPIIRVTHKFTNIDCDLSFTNGLAVENTKLIKKYLEVYPKCKLLILFLKDWLKVCDLGGEDGICSYAITWMVIYYLQTRYILPDVTKLIKPKKNSRVIDKWETGVSEVINVSTTSENFSFHDLLRGFFIMCGGFDFHNNIICPLMGRPIKKVDFLRPLSAAKLPVEMNRYKNYINSGKRDVKYFRIDSVMGVQDPFDLSHNLTKSVKKTTLYRFKTLCTLSAQKLTNS